MLMENGTMTNMDIISVKDEKWVIQKARVDLVPFMCRITIILSWGTTVTIVTTADSGDLCLQTPSRERPLLSIGHGRTGKDSFM
jgi:hypothetical protein